MKQTFIYIVILLAILNIACLETSDTNLYENGLPEVVVEGRITDMPPPYYVRISSSVNPEADINSLPINNAQVLINNNKGNIEILTSVGSGMYQADAIQGEIGEAYTIEVNFNNKLYQGTDSIRAAPSIDSVNAEYITETQRPDGWYIVFYSHKTSNISRFYKIELTINDSIYNGYYDLIYIEEIPGQRSQTWILPYKFELSDTVVTTVHSITETMYEYYRGLAKQVENSFGNIQPPMVNPSNNVEGALGYFQASSVWRDTTIIE